MPPVMVSIAIWSCIHGSPLCPTPPEYAKIIFMTIIKIYDARLDKVVAVEKIEKTDREWQQTLTPEQYRITTRKGTEVPGSCVFTEVHQPGIFKCVRCDTGLFRYATSSSPGPAGRASTSLSHR